MNQQMTIQQYDKTWTWLRKGNFKRETESLNDHHHHVVLVARISLTLSRLFSLLFIAVSSHSCWMYVRAGRPAFARPCVGIHKSTSLMSSSLLFLIAAQNNAIRINHIEARIDKTQQYSKCRRCGDRDETIIHIISECSKLAQMEYKAKNDWVGKVIHWEMCKKFRFDHTNKWYMHNPAAVLENDTHKLIWDFNIHADHLTSARRSDLIIINKKKRTCKIVNFAVPAGYKIKLKEREKKDKYLDLARELKNQWIMQVTIIPIVSGAFGIVTKGLLKGLEDLKVGGRVETIQITTLLRTARILRRVLETWGDLLSLKLQWKTIS